MLWPACRVFPDAPEAGLNLLEIVIWSDRSRRAMTRTPRKIMLQPATTLNAAIAAFNPRQPLVGQQIPAFYVERPRSPWRSMQQALARGDSLEQPVRLLLSGNTGSGKTTEINKLCFEAGSRFRIIAIHTNRLPQLFRMSMADAVFMMAAAWRAADETEPAHDALRQDIHEYFSDDIFAGNIRLLGRDDTLGGLVRVEFDARYLSRSEQWIQRQRAARRRLPNVVATLNHILSQMRAADRRPALFIFDDTDKIALPDAESIFLAHGHELAGVAASVVYTLASGVWHSPRFAAARAWSTAQCHLDDLRDSMDDVESVGWRNLDEVIARRADAALFAPDARRAILHDCQGRLGRLIELAHYAAVNALGRGAARIELVDADRASAWFHQY